MMRKYKVYEIAEPSESTVVEAKNMQEAKSIALENMYDLDWRDDPLFTPPRYLVKRYEEDE